MSAISQNRFLLAGILNFSSRASGAETGRAICTCSRRKRLPTHARDQIANDNSCGIRIAINLLSTFRARLLIEIAKIILFSSALILNNNRTVFLHNTARAD